MRRDRVLQSSDIKKKALNKWPQYRKYLVSSVIGDECECFFPLKIIGDKTPKADWQGMIEDYREIISSSKEKQGIGYTLLWEERKTRDKGIQSFVKEISIENEEDYLYLTDGRSKSKAIKDSLSVLFPLFKKYSSNTQLEKWISNNTKEIENTVKDKKYWLDIISVIEWSLTTENRRNYYTREIPLPLHTKFIENNSSTIISLHKAITGEEDITSGKTSITEELDLKKKPVLIRFRMSFNSFTWKEMAIDSDSFSVLDKNIDLSQIKRVFVIENEAVYLSFPVNDDEMAIFGSGFMSHLIQGEWIKNKEIIYFGDLDEHGLSILSLFRSTFPDTKSFLMNKETYFSFSTFAVKGERVDSDSSFKNLDKEEFELLGILKDNREKNRLEQERIDQAYIVRHLNNLRERSYEQ